LTRGGTQRRVKWKNIGALIDDLESRGNSRLVLGPVASGVIEKRLAEALLGLRPTLKPKQMRKFEQIGIAKKPVLSLEVKPKLQPRKSEQIDSGGLASLRLTPRVMMLFHSLHIRSLQDLRRADEKLLAKHLTMIEVRELKRRSAASLSPPKIHQLVRTANLPLRTVQVLNAMGVIKITDLAEVSEAELRAEPKLGKTEMLAIFRVCREHDIRLKGA
jgi:hypothetical protein